jgi:ATP-binding cassette subfamily B protein
MQKFAISKKHEIMFCMKTLYNYLKKHTRLIIIALVLAAINQIFSLLDPLIFRHVIDDYATKYEQYSFEEFLSGILKLLAAVIGVAFISRVAKNLQDYYINVITQKIGAQIYSDGLAHSLELPYSVFEDQQSGQTLSRLLKVRSDVEKLISSFINILFTTLVGFIFVAIYACNAHWLIAPIYILSVPIIGFVSFYLSKKIKLVQQKIVRETTALAGSTTESLRNIELVKSLGLADQEINRLNSITDKILALELKKVRYVRSLSFIQGTIINFIRTSILFAMLYLIFIKEITFGQFFSLYIYSFYIFGPLQELGNIIGIYRETEVSLKNFQDILDTPIEPKPANPILIEDLSSLEFKNVSFAYSENSKPATSDISFNAKLGETVAFVGPSGSGKTTLVKLLVGLYRPVKGEILYNGYSIEKIDLDLLKEQIGFVTQDTQLFAGTIKDNLLFVNPKANEEDCLNVLKKASCLNLLERAEKGLNTIIGEGGVKISGGERQRLSIARALLRKPALLIFDEATSSLDSLTELEISHTVREISNQGKHITILIAHRLSTIMHADTIFVLEKGKIIESGKHNELLESKGLYYAMWRQQIGEEK